LVTVSKITKRTPNHILTEEDRRKGGYAVAKKMTKEQLLARALKGTPERERRRALQKLCVESASGQRQETTD
jgi:hypothetical protein